MSTLEDKILGEKTHNYCSSSEDSEPEENTAPPPTKYEWKGTATNTGPKGVKNDWQQFKQLENEKRIQRDLERINLAQQCTMTVQTALDIEKEQALMEDPEFANLMEDDEFMAQYRKQRMEEMIRMRKNPSNKKFGTVLHLRDGSEYLDAIDLEDKSVTIIIHIYEDRVKACKYVNECLVKLAQMYEYVKFCKFIASQSGMSKNFKVNGVPALLIYKSGDLIGNFVKLTDELGEEISVEEVQGYLIEHGMLEDLTCVPAIINNSD